MVSMPALDKLFVGQKMIQMLNNGLLVAGAENNDDIIGKSRILIERSPQFFQQ